MGGEILAGPARQTRKRAGRTKIRNIPVAKIRPEEGLERKRDRAGHQELCRSIAQFGVLTPITVRPAPGSSGEYLLVKGQGRTLACLQLGIKTIPANVVQRTFSETEKVQQFLVENVARLRMKPADRALLIAHARAAGEETKSVAERFGISAATVRKLEAQLDGASDAEIAALRRGDVTLATQAVVARLVEGDERLEVIEIVSRFRLSSVDLHTLFLALGWQKLSALGPEQRAARMSLLRWACGQLAEMSKGSPRSKITQLAGELPCELGGIAVEAV